VTGLLQHLVDIVTLGSLYALLGLGIALIFGVMRLINFAYGELIMVSAYVPALLLDTPWPIVVAVALVVPMLFALAMERIAFRPIRGASEGTMLVASFALSYLLQNLALLIFGATPRSTGLLADLNASVTVLGLTVPKLSIVTVAVTAVLLAALSYFLGRTSGGIQMRAAAENFRMARVLGVRADVVIAGAFAISGLLCGVCAVLIVAQTGTVTPTIGLQAVLVAFIATILGGMGSPVGAVAGGFALATLTAALESTLPDDLRPFRDAVAYSLVVFVLIYRPQGLVTPPGTETRV
jgi:branched-chain amino acid transport system permease protein